MNRSEWTAFLSCGAGVCWKPGTKTSVMSQTDEVRIPFFSSITFSSVSAHDKGKLKG